ncbi:MAG: phospholipase D-like domain-containing protein [Candidatus Acetothermia bacterium]|jgi:cardiolipin synthase|nr:phospholipase D-like domain-containing protein [Candidatus Acetothermia bacterium]
MNRVAIVVLVLAWTGAMWAMPVAPLVTRPGQPAYVDLVLELIASAEEEIQIALSDMRLYGNGATLPLLDALVAAAGRGVRVRVLVERREGEPYREQEAAVAYLRDRGVEVAGDDPEVTLHAKFLVVDGRWAVIGSTHWTWSALERSVQVDLAVDSPELAAFLAVFFDLLWDGRLRARPRLSEPPWPEPALVPLFDLPEGNLHASVIPELIARAARRVDVLLYRLVYYPQFADSPANRIVDALCAAAARGVQVRVLLEGGEDFPDLAQENRLSAAYLTTCGAAVRFDPPGTTLHAKCLIVDERDVMVTSANWSYYSLARNVEAGLALLGVPELGRPLTLMFEELWTTGRPLR